MVSKPEGAELTAHLKFQLRAQALNIKIHFSRKRFWNLNSISSSLDALAFPPAWFLSPACRVNESARVFIDYIINDTLVNFLSRSSCEFDRNLWNFDEWLFADDKIWFCLKSFRHEEKKILFGFSDIFKMSNGSQKKCELKSWINQNRNSRMDPENFTKFMSTSLKKPSKDVRLQAT